ncbi:hypothetical protein BHE74_00002753 [Ensete ventricosum]|nr:hypothetical protein BHE74_00002753 [Ensete ventricosum]RZR80526.1 hypothetical protein BHM03_00006575 [Ensete ventricosum]
MRFSRTKSYRSQMYGRRRVKQCSHQVLPPVDPVRVVAGPGDRVHEQVTGMARVSPLPVHPGARRSRLQRRLRRPLEEAVVKRVGDDAGQHACQVDHHGVDPDVAVGRLQRLRLRPVRGLVEGPRALSRALGRRIGHPDVDSVGLPDGTVAASPAHAETLDRDVFGREHQRDPALLRTGLGRQLWDLGRLEGLAHGTLAVRHLVGRHNFSLLLPLPSFLQVNPVDGVPPLGDRRR